MIEITLLQPEDEEEYETVLKTNEHNLLYSSIKYRNLLRRIVGGEDYYLIAKQDSQIVGIFPAFLKRNSKYGNVLNSLPFYGSNGGIICRSFLPNAQSIKQKLLSVFHDLAMEKEAIVSTIITSPFERDIDIYNKFVHHDYQDNRIGQITTLPLASENLDSELMAMLHYKTRNMVRKAFKAGIQYRHSSDIDDLRFLAETHKENLEAIGGSAKSWYFFSLLSEIFEYDTDYRIYIAELNGKRIAALLIFYYNRTVEYFTPAIVAEYRNMQPNSLLVFEAMKDAALRGYRYWNFGGTRDTLKGVYDFKKRWGTKDYPYYYYVSKYGDISELLKIGKLNILKEYEYFYVIPFLEPEVKNEAE